MTLQHVSLETRPGDIAAELRFWALLGFTEVPPPGGVGARAVWVASAHPPGTQIHLLLADDPVTMPRGHVAVVAPDFDATIAALRSAGHIPEEREPHWGAARCYVRSPAGHLVEVMAAPPA